MYNYLFVIILKTKISNFVYNLKTILFTQNNNSGSEQYFWYA